jgi:glutamine amidotransferase
MCELFAISSRLPATVSLSLKILAEHGGGSATHTDGWGIAYYREDDVRLIKDASAAYDSDWVHFVQSRDLSSTTIISHIRKATRGGVRLQNTHPFARELGGQMHVIAHNGTLKGVHDHPDFTLGHFRPIGDTDSEHAFCNLLARMEDIWLSDGGVPPLDQRFAVFTVFAEQARTLGSANFLYADGDYLFVQANQRHQEDGTTRPPGLYVLNRRSPAAKESISGGGVSVTGETQAITLFASVPLTDEDWQPLPKNAILALSQGEIVARA